MEYKCNICKETFNEQEITLKTEKLNNGIEQIYYNCPKCGARYDVCKTSVETRMLQAQIKSKALLIKKKLDKNINTINDVEKLNKLILKHKSVMGKMNGG